MTRRSFLDIRRNVRVSLIVTALTALLLPLAAAAQEPRLDELSAQWWQWGLSIPTPQNPQLDATGGNCMIGQRGSVWFLAGVWLGGTASRTCSIPEGTVLFFPVINAVNVNAPNVCGQGPGNLSVKDMRQASAASIQAATDLSVTVDGKAIHDLLRIQSVVFDVALPQDNIFDAPCGGPGTVPAGIYSPAVDDGFYVRLEPLKIGNHTLHISGKGDGFTEDVIYTLTVVPVLDK
jgi:hypothetical protein